MQKGIEKGGVCLQFNKIQTEAPSGNATVTLENHNHRIKWADFHSYLKLSEGRSEWGFLKFEVPSFTIQPYKSMYIHMHPHQSRYPYSKYQSVVSPSVSNVQSRQFRILFGVRVQLCPGHCGCPASHFPRFEGKTPDFRCFNQVIFPQTVAALGVLTVRVKAWCRGGLIRASARAIFDDHYSTNAPSSFLSLIFRFDGSIARNCGSKTSHATLSSVWASQIALVVAWCEF